MDVPSKRYILKRALTAFFTNWAAVLLLAPATAAAQDLTKPDLVELNDLRGKIGMKDNTVTDVVAQSGIYNSKNEVLKLGQNTVVTSTSGYKVLIDNAVISEDDGSL